MNIKIAVTDYLKLARFDHWIKQLFILPGAAFAYFLIKPEFNVTAVLFALISTGFTASANYVINEFLDAAYDKFHPEKSLRTAVKRDLNKYIVLIEYAAFASAGILTAAFCINKEVMFLQLALLFMGLVYNVKPFRSKDIAYIDVLSESFNNAIRLLIGWFALASNFLPPASVIVSYWFGGAFLMAMKRFAEYRFLLQTDNGKEKAVLYRKSFRHYNEKSLLTTSFFYALISIFFCGIFLVKYRIELIFAMPFICGLFCVYFHMSLSDGQSAYKPEKLMREKFLVIYLILLLSFIVLLMIVDIPLAEKMLETTFIGV